MHDRLLRKRLSTTALLVVLGVSASSPAFAGFQWVAPSDSAPAPMMVSPQAPAVASPEIISPVVITGSATAAPAPAQTLVAPAQQPVAVAPQQVMAAPQVLAAPAPAAPMALIQQPQPAPMVAVAPQAMAPAMVAVPAPVADGVVVGFAKSVPLAVALRQILPNGYAFSIDQDVDMGTLVSFQGGRPWRETLRDSLAPAGLAARENGQMVAIGFASHNLATVVAPMAPAPIVATAPMAVAPAPTQLLQVPPQTVTPLAPAMAAPVMPQAQTQGMPVITGAEGNPAAVTESWTGERGQSLRKVLEGWARRSNVEFDWLSEYDYPLEASVAFSGGFEGAVRSLLTGFENAHPQPVAELHSNPNIGQMVLVVQTRGNTNSD